MSLRRVPPNLLVGQGAVEFAACIKMPILPHDALVSPSARERWLKWRNDLKNAEKNNRVSLLPATSGRETDPIAEDRLREQARVTHTNALESGVWNEAQPTSPPPPSDPMDFTCPSSKFVAPQSDAAANVNAAADVPIDPASTVHSDPYGPPGMHQEHGYAQTLGSSSIDSHRIDNGHEAGDYFPSTDTVEMDDYRSYPGLFQSRHSGWNDGSSTPSVAGSSSASSSLQLPSLTPSPEPDRRTAGLSSEFGDLHVRLPGTSNEDSSPTEHLATASNSLIQEPSNREDNITDTVGAIAIDGYGNIACGASSGGIGMKHRGRIGPAALVGIGSAVIPTDPDDKERVCVAAVTSGTGEHMATTMAATVTCERLYHGVKKVKGGKYVETDDADSIKMFIERDFMGEQY